MSYIAEAIMVYIEKSTGIIESLTSLTLTLHYVQEEQMYIVGGSEEGHNAMPVICMLLLR